MPDVPEIAAAAATALGATPTEVTPLPGGRNNVVARVVLGDRSVLGKAYFAHADDRRDRLGTEFTALSFLWDRGVRCIPRPLAVDRGRGVGLYEFVAGRPVEPGTVSAGDALQLGELLARMWELRADPDAQRLDDASEASFSLRGYFELLDARLARLRAAPPSDEPGVDVHTFVADEVAPAVLRVREYVEATATELGFGEELPPADRTLSPGDIGFHNALRRDDGSLVFVDFEYAGWDDPAHALAGVCLAPGIPLPRDRHLDVLSRLLARFDGASGLARRLRLVYPILALKWSLIMLNEFVPSDAERRAFARSASRPAAQIEKSRHLLRTGVETARPGCFLEALPDSP